VNHIEHSLRARGLSGQATHAGLAALLAQLGPAVVTTDPAQLREPEQATYATAQRFVAWLRPRDEAQTVLAVRIAAEHRLALHVVSTGRNWGYGSRVAVRDGCVLLDLSGLDRILDFSEELGFLRVQPGVTFDQAYRFLCERQSRLILSVTGSSPHTSLIGNALERGIGRGTYSDRFAHTCALKVLLPTGEVLHTDFARFEGSRTANLHRWGLGPAVDGLFSQSNFGIVLEMTHWLTRRPPFLGGVDLECTDDQLPAVVDTLRELRMEQLIQQASLMNPYRLLTVTTRIPRSVAKLTAAQRRDFLTRFLASQRLSFRWSGQLELAGGTRDEIDLRAAYLASRLEGKARCVAMPAYDTSLPPEPQDLRRLGIPTGADLRAAYWRKSFWPAAGRELDPDRDRCGVLWIAPTVPLLGTAVAELVTQLSEVILEHGFEPALTVRLANERCAEIICLLTYDRELPDEEDRALACHDSLVQQLFRSGHSLYRLNTRSMDWIPPGRDQTDAVLARLQRALDPDGLLSPGRYDAVNGRGPES
jgi:4-cresol dehydrogenase (hydroxylating)